MACLKACPDTKRRCQVQWFYFSGSISVVLFQWFYFSGSISVVLFQMVLFQYSYFQWSFFRRDAGLKER